LTITAGAGQGTVAAQAFMPGDVTIAVGDSVTIVIGSDDPHTITMNSGPPGMPPFIWPVSGFEAPAEGSPPPFDLGTASTDGTEFVNSGILFGPGSSATLEFTTAGTFPFFCVIHPGMAGTVTVVDDGPVTTQEEADAAAEETREFLLGQVDSSRQDALDATSVVDNDDGSQTWNVFADAGTSTGPLPGGGSGHLELLEFTPDAISIAAGDTINWTSSRIHTITFVPIGMELRDVFPDEGAAAPPSGGSSYDGTEAVNSGFLGVPGPDGVLVDQYSLTFPQAGEYKFFCAIHAELGQVGAVVVS
jgi:plastocyanin